MRRKVTTYLDLEGYDSLCYSVVDDVLYRAYKDGVTELICTKEELDKFERYFICYGSNYDWQKKVFINTKLVVE